MIVNKKIIKEEDESIGYIECIFDSSNILMSTYFPKQKRLYIAFKRGGMYSYGNINEELYEEFENSDSQGKFFQKNIRNNENFPYYKEYTLFKSEIEDAENIIKEWEENQQKKNL